MTRSVKPAVDAIRASLVLAVVLIASTLGGAVADPAAAATPTHVAIVIDGQYSRCVAWHSGITGMQVLTSAAQITIDKTGLVTFINGVDTSRPSTSQYWAYFENGAWSNRGPASTKPAPGTVEGWKFGNGDAAPAGSYASICAGADAPAKTGTTPSRAPSSTVATKAAGAPTTVPVSSHRAAAHPAGSVGATPSAGSTSSTAGAARSASGPTTRPSATRSSTAVASPLTATDGRTDGAGGAASTAHAASSPSATQEAAAKRNVATVVDGAGGLVLAALALTALVGGAIWQRRRAH